MPAITKKKKNKPVAAYVFWNANKPISADAREVLQQVLQANNTEDDTMAKRKKKRSRMSVRVPTAAHAAAEGVMETTKADVGYFESNAVPQPGHPVDNAHSPSGAYAADRDSSPIMAGHAAQSPGNYSNFDRPDGSAIAAGHIDLRQSSVRTIPFANLARTNRDGFVGMSAFGGQFASTDAPRDAPGTSVRVTQLNAAGSAGSYAGLNSFDDRPGGATAEGHQSRGSATSPNGSHSTANAVSSSVPAMKSSEALEIIKAAMRGR